MSGRLPFGKSLHARLKLFSAHRRHLLLLTELLRRRVSPSFARNRAFWRHNGRKVLVLSGGFRDYIVPVLRPYGIPARNIHANEFSFARDGRIAGVKPGSPLSSRGGKARALKALRLKADIVAVGDGRTDLELKDAGAVQAFFAFTETVRRPAVVRGADAEVRDFDALIGALT